MDQDEAAMKRRDEAAAVGANVCPRCDGCGALEGFTAEGLQAICPVCQGETWVDKDGNPLRIDPSTVRITVSK